MITSRNAQWPDGQTIRGERDHTGTPKAQGENKEIPGEMKKGTRKKNQGRDKNIGIAYQGYEGE